MPGAPSAYCLRTWSGVFSLEQMGVSWHRNVRLKEAPMEGKKPRTHHEYIMTNHELTLHGMPWPMPISDRISAEAMKKATNQHYSELPMP